MFDFTKITETLSSLGGSDNKTAAGLSPALTNTLESAGLDISALEGLAPQEIMSLLGEYGIDPAQLTEGQLGELIQGAGVPGQLIEIATSWFGDRSR